MLTPAVGCRISVLAEQFKDTMAKVSASLAGVSASVAKFMAPAIAAANDPVRVAGIEARYYVRAGMEPAYAEPLAVDCLVQVILRGEGDDDLALLTEANRHRVAVAAMRGWATHQRGAAA